MTPEEARKASDAVREKAWADNYIACIKAVQALIQESIDDGRYSVEIGSGQVFMVSYWESRTGELDPCWLTRKALIPMFSSTGKLLHDRVLAYFEELGYKVTEGSRPVPNGSLYKFKTISWEK